MSSQPSTLGQELGPEDQAPSQITLPAQDSSNSDGTQLPQAPKQPSRLLSTLASIVSGGLQSIPDQGRPTFVTGLGQGARTEAAIKQQQQTQQTALKFRNFDDSVRAAQLAIEEKHAQAADEEHQAHMTEFAQQQADRMTSQTGMTYTFVPNDDNGAAVINHLQTGMANSPDGKVSVPAGTIPAPGGWLVPNKGSDQIAQANTKDFNARASFYGLNPTTNGRVVTPAAYDSLSQMSRGYRMQADGHTVPMHADEIRAITDNMQSELTKYQKQPNADENTINAISQDIQHLNGLADIREKRETAAKSKAQAQQLDTLNKSEAIKAKYAEEKQDNAAANKPQKPVSNQWQPGATAMQKNKADLAENMVFNANNVASLLMRRPDIVGAVAGRFTTLDQMKGTNDPDIVQLATDIENIAKANAGLHGQKAQEAVKQYEDTVLNHFKNGPAAIYGGLKSSTDSVQTFIDAARPDTYKTHSKQGGAARAMVPQQ